MKEMDVAIVKYFGEKIVNCDLEIHVGETPGLRPSRKYFLSLWLEFDWAWISRQED